MGYYLISYDLLSQNHDYIDLYMAIKSLGDWQHPLESVWILYSNLDSNRIYESVKNTLMEGDRIIVMSINPDDIQGWLSRSFWQWLNDK